MSSSGQPELVRAIGRWSLVALTVNCIIGSGIFGLPAVIAGQLGRWAPLGWIVAAAGIGAIMGCFAEVASRFSEAGGPYVYARAAFGRFIGIETGWITWLTRLAASAASTNLFVDSLGQFVPEATTGVPRALLLTAIVGVLLAINVRGVRSGAQTSNLFTAAKLVPLSILIGTGAIFILSRGWNPAVAAPRPGETLDALVLLMFAYGGFESAMIPLGEARDPRRDAPFALGAALACCALVFTSIQIVVMGTVSDPASTRRPLAAAAQVTMGDAGAVLLTIGALFSTYGLLSANLLNAPRLTYALARQGDFPAFFAATHPRFRTPWVSIAIFAALLWTLSVAGGFRWNAVLSTVARIFTYAVVCAALPVLRRTRPGEERFHLRGGTACAAVGIAFCALVGSRTGRTELVILLVTAAVAALNWRLARAKRPAGGAMTKFLASLAVVALAAPASAQEKPASPPPISQLGRAPEMADSKLAPHPGKMTETPPSEIPVDRIRLPEGFKAELWAHGLPGGRAMARGDKGKIYVGTRGIGRVYEITDRGDRRTVRIVAEKMRQPAGVAFANGSLYVAAIDKMLRYDGIEDNPEVAPVDLTSHFGLPPEPHHNWKHIAFGPDKKLYVPFGAPCNICEPSAQYAQIRRYDPDGSHMEVLARGIRNSIGFDWHPRTKELWFTDNGRDWMGDEGPEDELNRISKAGLDFGFPYCHANGVPDSQFRKDDPCKGVTMPVALLGPHTAALGMIFYTGQMFPPAYKDAIFVARKGSWNRTKLAGFDVVSVKADPDGKNAKVTPFMTGFMDAAQDRFWGRPAYVLQMPDGALLVSDEQNGAIYRVSWRKPGA